MNKLFQSTRTRIKDMQDKYESDMSDLPRGWEWEEILIERACYACIR